jgi:heme/copper-type cytochrome/quinol oxidase subunit 2
MGSKVGFIWVYAIIIIFSIGIIEMLIMPAIEFKLMPALQTTANNTLAPVDAAAYQIQIHNMATYMHTAMYVIFFVVFVYAVVSIFKREESEIQF